MTALEPSGMRRVVQHCENGNVDTTLPGCEAGHLPTDHTPHRAQRIHIWVARGRYRLQRALCLRQSAFWHRAPQYRTSTHPAQKSSGPSAPHELQTGSTTTSVTSRGVLRTTDPRVCRELTIVESTTRR